MKQKAVEVMEVDRRRGTVTILAGEFSLKFCLVDGKVMVVSKANLLKDRLYSAEDLWVPPHLLKKATRQAAAILFENKRKSEVDRNQLALFRN